MKFLVVGDIVGKSGLNRLKEELSSLLKEQKIDFCIVNGENSANGKGIRIQEYSEIINAGADIITMGNHIYYRKEMAEQYLKLPRLVLPANVTNISGNGSVVIEKNGVKLGVINLIGRVEMGDMFENNTTNPFETVIQEVDKLNAQSVDYIFVDFHAEATAEKIAMGYFLEGKVNCVFGTHTHVQTADETILKNKTAYITDVGMTGPRDSVLGLKREIALKRFVTGAYAKYECSDNKAIFNAIIVNIDENTKEVLSIERINR